MRLGIFGSRTLSGITAYRFIKERISEQASKKEIEMLVVPGGIDGACKLASKIAKELDIPLLTVFYKSGVVAFHENIKNEPIKLLILRISF